MGSAGRSIDELLEDITSWGERLARFTSGIERAQFQHDEIRQLAVWKSVEVIGEAAGNILKLYPAFVAVHPELQFAEAYRMRNRLAHGYDSIDWAILWDTAAVHVPALIARIEALKRPGSA